MPQLSLMLRERGYVYQHSTEKLEEITDSPSGGKRTLYLGIDPSADSLQAGQLLGFLVLRRFLEDGHRVVLVIGGGTGMVGDPGGRSVERVLLDAASVKQNAEKITEQAKRLLGSSNFTLLDNVEWLGKLRVIDFLRDVGKHFSVNTMLQRDFVKGRIENVEQGISYTEFSYALLQAYDYWYLHTNEKCDVQVGGSDQWGNIISGVDFIRRKTGDTVYALTWPLLINKATGKKFGKSEEGAIWLDKKKTSIFDFYQFWLSVEDADVEAYLFALTMLPKIEIEAALELHKRDPKERHAQQLLAREVTNLVHGVEETTKAEAVSQVLFGDIPIFELSDDAVQGLRESAPLCPSAEGVSIVDALVQSSFASSKREAREFLSKKAVELNGVPVSDPEHILEANDFHKDLALLKRGKRSVCVLVKK